MALDILELRAYARAKELLDNSKDRKDVPDHPMIDQVFWVVKELSDRRKEGK